MPRLNRWPVKSIHNNMETLKEFWAFIKTRKKYWLIPLIVLLMMIGTIVVLTAGSALAPFIYSLF